MTRTDRTPPSPVFRADRLWPFEGGRAGFSRTMFLALAVLSILGGSSLAAGPPAVDKALSAWFEVREWLDDGEFPELGTSSSEIRIDAASAVGVLLRLDGRIVGRGLDLVQDADIIRRAAGRAYSQALGDRVIRDLPENFRRDVGSRLALELEIAGPRSTLVAGSLAAAAARIRPGIDGIAILRGDRVALSLPGRQLATGTAGATASTLLRLIDQLGLPPRDLEELRRLDAIQLQRFETIRIGQAGSDQEPGLRTRSGAFIPRAVLDEHLIKTVRDRLSNRLARWRPEADPRVDRMTDEKEPPARPWLGDHDPVGDRYQPVEAPWRDRLLGIRAVASIDPALIDERDLTLPDEDLLDAEVVDLGLLASTAAGLPNATVAWLAATERFPPDDSSVGLARRAAAIGSVNEEAVSKEAVQEAHDDAWAACRSASEVIAAFDWLALAEHRLTERRDGEPTERAISLRAVRDALLIRQIDDAGRDEDGGIPLRRGGVEMIDARNLRLMLAIGLIDGLPGDDDAGRRRSREGLEGLFRLVRQLMLDDDQAADLPGGRTAAGGVALGLYEPRQPLAATATALLAIDRLPAVTEAEQRREGPGTDLKAPMAP